MGALSKLIRQACCQPAHLNTLALTLLKILNRCPLLPTATNSGQLFIQRRTGYVAWQGLGRKRW